MESAFEAIEEWLDKHNPHISNPGGQNFEDTYEEEEDEDEYFN